MAYLILNNEGTYAGEFGEFEKFYEFDSKDKKTVQRIHQILALRKKGIAIDSDKILSDICEETLESDSKQKNTLISDLFESAKRYLSRRKRNTAKTMRNTPQPINSYSYHLYGSNLSSPRGQ